MENILIGLATIGVLALVVYLFILTGPTTKAMPSQPPEFQFSVHGSSRQGKGALSAPLAVAVFQDRIYVADSGRSRIQIFTYDGEFVNSLSTAPTPTKKERKPLSYPVGIALDNTGNIFIADLYSARLLVFDNNGSNYKFPPTGQRSYLKKPIAVAVTKDRIYVIDAGDSKVKIFNTAGKLLLTFGGKGFKQGEFRFPNGIAVDKSGKIYVADTGNARVQVFNPKGKLLLAFDGRPQIRFTFPRGIAIDPWQRIHIVDTFDKQVYVFNSKGRYLFSYGSGAGNSDNESFSFPSGIAIDQKTGRIFIADRANNRLSVWDYPE